MEYVSTRGTAPALNFEDVLLTGLARDGGLYVPAEWPSLRIEEIRDLAGLDYRELAKRIIWPFLADEMPQDRFDALVERAYARFDHRAVTPLVELDAGQWLMELFHGPTLAFKDVALQLVGLLFDYFLERRGARATIIVATSGDTGSAAIEAARGRSHVDIFCLHPKDRVSEVQRRQMTTVTDANVHNLAIAGTFDDCQALVKAAFIDSGFRDAVGLTGMNSINWARIVPQAVYYFHAALALGGPARPISFSVPTGNFGDIYAGYVAKRMGLPIATLGIATNVNDILVRTLETGRYELEKVVPTMSPSMDIQVSSNFERLLFDLHRRDGGAVAGLMARMTQSGAFDLDGDALDEFRSSFAARRIEETETLRTISEIHATTGMLIDPHTAVGVRASAHFRADPGVPVVTLATAHPAKFPDAVERATGVRPALPVRLSDLNDRVERYDVIDNDAEQLKRHIRDHISEPV